MEIGSLSFWIVVCIVNGLIGAAIGQAKGRPVGGFVLGFVVGPIGWALVAFGGGSGPKCPTCRGTVPVDASKCMHCGSAL